MKQKIFSLLVLMITTVSGAWAQDVTFRVQLSVDCAGLHVENGLFYGTEFFESQLQGGILISDFDLRESYFHLEKGLEVEISQIESPSYPSGFSYGGGDFLIWMSDNQKFNANVSIPITVKEGVDEYEGSVTVSVYHNTHSSTATVWQKDGSNHWHQCNYEYGMCDHSDASKLDLAPHTFSSGFCIDCGQPYPHEHSFSTTAWKQTTTHHFHPCTAYADCPLAFTHGYDDPKDDAGFSDAYEALSTAEKDYFAYGAHQDNIVYGKCDDCGYVMGGSEPVTGHGHTFENSWSYIPEGHYHKCTTSESDYQCIFNEQNGGYSLANLAAVPEAGFADHVYDPESPTPDVCFCGYDKSGEAPVTEHVHSFSEDWIQTETHHFHPCTNSACPLASAHGLNNPTQNEDFFNAWQALDNPQLNAFDFSDHYEWSSPKDGNCDKCGYEMTPAHEHTFSADWTQTETHHYHKCIGENCPLNSVELTAEAVAALNLTDQASTGLAFAPHVYDQEGIKCVCGASMPAHTHDFSADWIQTETYHFHPCKDSSCPLASAHGLNDPSENKAFNEAWGAFDTSQMHAFAFDDHSDVNPQDGKCDVCGYEMTEHVHSFSEDWYEMTVGEKGYHYKKCTADGCTIDYENMSDFEKAITSYGQHQYGTSQEGEAYYTCKVCGKVNTDRQAIQHEHNYQWVSIATAGETDDPEHWQECVATEGACTAPKVVPGEKKHKFAEDATDYTYYTCSICGYIDENRKDHAPHVHEFAEAWSNNETHHYHECIGTQGECTLKYDGTDNEALEKYGEHTYGASQEGAKYYTCQTCGYINTERKNAAHTHAYGDWQHDNVQHWKECTAADGEQLAGPCTEPKGSVGYHEYASTDNAATPEDDRALCSVCGWYNEARKTAIDNAASAAEVQSWSWDYEIPFNFEATVQNDRRFNAEQCYTIFLPYALELNGLKAYTIEQHNDNIVGFKEQAITELPQLTPFVVKSETTGNPLSSAMTTVYATLLSADQADWMTADEKSALLPDRGYAADQPSIHSTGGRLHMLGTLRYLVGNEANGRYIMQGKDAKHPNGVFKLIDGTTSDNAGYDKVDNRACILPMRAHIETLGGDSREFLGVRLIKADGSVTTIDRLVLDPADNTVYDLQGRRVQNPRKGSLYIIGGRKVMMK